MADGTSRPIETKEVDHKRERTLSLEVRSHRFGFAFFEGWNLLDWGVRRYPDCGVAAAKLGSLVTLYSPSVVVIRQVRRVRGKEQSSAAKAIHEIRRELVRSKIKYAILKRPRIQDFFAGYDCRTKHEIASRLAGHFPTLKSMVPRPRRPWTPEPHATVIFDAVGTNAAFVGKLPDPNFAL